MMCWENIMTQKKQPKPLTIDKYISYNKKDVNIRKKVTNAGNIKLILTVLHA